jgi:hypothetical protein
MTHRKSKVLILGRKIGNPGEEWLFTEMARCLSSNSEVKLLSCEGSVNTRTMLDGVDVVLRKHKAQWRIWRTVKLLIANIHFSMIIWMYRPDKIVTSSSLSFYGLTIFLSKFFFRNQCEVISIVWDIYPLHVQRTSDKKRTIFYRVFYCFERAVYNMSDIVAVPNRDYARILKVYFGPAAAFRILPIWTWGDEKKNESEFGENTDVVSIVYGGTFDEARDIEGVIDGLAITDMHFKFFLYGQGRNYDICSERYSSDGRFIFMGLLSREDFSLDIVKYDLGVVVTGTTTSMPSFPSKTLDYARGGLGILALVRNNPSYTEQIEKIHVCGMVVRNITNFQSAVESYLNDSEMLLRHKKNSSRLYKAHHATTVFENFI